MIKFWELPEAVEQFLPYNDVFTILSLTEVFPATLKALKGVKVWDNLIRRTFTLPLEQGGCWPKAEIQDQKTKMSYLSKILGKFDNTKKRELMLDLLHLIAQNCPVVIREVILSCPCNETHKVSVLGFRLLEEVESSIGTAEQQVVEIHYSNPHSDFLTALRSRVQRQERMIRAWYSSILTCSSLDDANAYHAIMEHCERITWIGGGNVWIEGDIGAEGWTALAAGLQRHPGLCCFEGRRLDIRAAPREALKMIWDAMDNHDDSYWSVTWVEVSVDGLGLRVRKNGLTKEENEMKWAEVVRILDMSEAEFQAVVELGLVQEEDSGEENLGEEAESEGEGMEEEDYQEHENY